MKIAFLILTAVSCLSSVLGIGYSIGDIIYEKRMQKRMPAPEPIPEPEPEPQPEPTPEPEPEPVPVVEEINAEEADELLTDEAAWATVTVAEAEEKANGVRAYINIGTLNEFFEPGSHVTLAILQERGLISPKVRRIKILADGILNRPLTVEAHAFSVQAVKMIHLTGGSVIVRR